MAKRGLRTLSATHRAALRDLLRDSGRDGARTSRLLGRTSAPVVGVFYRGREGGRVVSADRRNRHDYRVAEGDAAGANDEELVKIELVTTGRARLRRARIVERFGRSSDPGAISLLAVASHDIPIEFPVAAVAEAKADPPPNLAGRTDL